MSGKPTRILSSLRQAIRFRKSLPPGLEEEFIEYKDIKSIDRIAVAAWIGFSLSFLLLPLDYSRFKAGEFYAHETYRYLFYLHIFGLIFLLPAWSMTFHKSKVIATRLRRGIHIWGMVVLSYIYLFGMGLLVFWDRDGLIIYMAFIFISTWMFAMSHNERLLFNLTTFPIMVLFILVKPADLVSYDKMAMLYEITFLTIVAFIFDTFDYNLNVSNFLALKKNQAEEYENKVEAMMLHRFTSIHPAIHWRFREEAIRLLDNTKTQEVEHDILFEDVFPFYGSLDVRHSSEQRQKAIAQDLLFTLELALNVLHQSHDLLSFDILDELISEAEKYRDKINTHFSSGDEAGIAGFIRKDINPVIDHLRLHYEQVQTITQNYQEVCAATGICTKYKKGNEEALSMINQRIASYLDEEEKELQRLYPCYFDKYLTDGLEYNIYAGPSIASGRHLDPLYLDNIRLRQLLWTRKMIIHVDELQPQIKRLLHSMNAGSITQYEEHKDKQQIEIAPLILAYMTPITLKFRSDEKRIDVHGSYSIRYAMLKKRIDKAVISGTAERLTQPGSISIVYTQDQEAADYEKHLQYLMKKNLIQPGWEQLTLDPMPGAEGLKALRVNIKY